MIHVFLPVLIGSCGYKPCSDLEDGDVVLVTITEVNFVDCPAEYQLPVGTELQLTVDGSLRGERCESATGEIHDRKGVIEFSEPLSLEDESSASGDFFGRYEIKTGACDGWGDLSAEFELNGSRKGKAIIDADMYSEECDATCFFSAAGVATQL